MQQLPVRRGLLSASDKLLGRMLEALLRKVRAMTDAVDQGAHWSPLQIVRRERIILKLPSLRLSSIVASRALLVAA